MKFLILRRISQILILGLFFASNYYGVKILQGNLSSSLLFGVLPLSDPFAVLQLFLASFSIASGCAFRGGYRVCFLCDYRSARFLRLGLPGKYHNRNRTLD